MRKLVLQQLAANASKVAEAARQLALLCYLETC